MRNSETTTKSQLMHFENGVAIGTADQWLDSQYCKILTPAGVVGCAIFNLAIAEEVGSAMAIVKGNMDDQLYRPEQLLDARITGVSSRAAELGVAVGMTGREAVERFLELSGEHKVEAPTHG
ncbi:MAG: DUF1805 domain-containing protein [Bauldia sp.]|nr:DUF1805 domain-containing protein [Bauldia sp.]